MKTSRLLVLAALLTSTTAAMALHQLMPVEFDLIFAEGAVALPQVERAKIDRALERIRQDPECPLGTVDVFPAVVAAEGSQDARRRLSIVRGAYVRELLKIDGVPEASILIAAEPPPVPSDFKSRADYFRARWKHDGLRPGLVTEADEHAPPPKEVDRYPTVGLFFAASEGSPDFCTLRM